MARMTSFANIPTMAPPRPRNMLELAAELADALHVLEECHLRGIQVTTELYDHIDALLDEAEIGRALDNVGVA